MDTLVYNSNNQEPKTNNIFCLLSRIFGTRYSFHNFELRSSDVVFLQHEEMYLANDPNSCTLCGFQLQ